MKGRLGVLCMTYDLKKFMSFDGRNEFLRDMFEAEGYLNDIKSVEVSLIDSHKYLPDRALKDKKNRVMVIDVDIRHKRRYVPLLAVNLYEHITDLTIAVMANGE